MKKRFKKFVIITALAITGTAGIYALHPKDNFFEISKNLEIFATLYRELNIFYVDEVQPGELMKTGIDAMLNSLDPYTNYITESKIEDYRFMTTGQYGGIGSLIRSVDGEIYISEPYEGFPAQQSGLKAGDRLILIDGIELEGKGQEEISKLLKGQSGTELSVTFERFGEIKEVTLTREKIKIPDVPYYGMLSDKIGYIRLNSFTRTASKEVREAFNELKDDQDMEQLVFDLRGNGGGLLREAVNIVNFFVPKGQEVVHTKGKIDQWDQRHVALNQPLDTLIPLVVLVDQGSASASEIVSGTMQDLDRGVVIGHRTYGKGLVQQTRDLEYNSKLKLTVAKYYIPSGRCIQKVDYAHKNDEGDAVEIPDSLLQTFQTKNGRIVKDGRGIMPDIQVEDTELPHIIASLLSENLFFRYGTKYASEHDTIKAAGDFALSAEEYDSFVSFLKDKNYSYTTDTETKLEKLIAIAKKEKYYGMANSEFEQLNDAVKSKKNKDLQIFKDEISSILENEIVSRYYFQHGRIESSLSSDDVVARAKEVLNDQQAYRAILQPND
jgi:carboxyl-terminal processing protease